MTTIYFPIGAGPDGMQPAFHVVQVFDEEPLLTPKPRKGTFKTNHDCRHMHKSVIKAKRESSRTMAMFMR